MASNGTVQAKTWNPNGLAAVANLPWDDVLQRNPNLSPGTLKKMVDLAHRRWCSNSHYVNGSHGRARHSVRAGRSQAS